MDVGSPLTDPPRGCIGTYGSFQQLGFRLESYKLRSRMGPWIFLKLACKGHCRLRWNIEDDLSLAFLLALVCRSVMFQLCGFYCESLKGLERGPLAGNSKAVVLGCLGDVVSKNSRVMGISICL